MLRPSTAHISTISASFIRLIFNCMRCHAKSGPPQKRSPRTKSSCQNQSPGPKLAAKYSPPKQIMVPLPDQNWQQKMVPLHTEVSPPTHNLNKAKREKKLYSIGHGLTIIIIKIIIATSIIHLPQFHFFRLSIYVLGILCGTILYIGNTQPSCVHHPAVCMCSTP